MRTKGNKQDLIKEEIRSVAESKLNKIQIDEIRESFKKYDTSKVGIITRFDLIAILKGTNSNLS